MESTHTTISCSPETRDAIKARKTGGEPYDAVLKRLLGEGGDE